MLLNPDTELLDDGLDRLAAAALELGGLVGPAGAEPRRLDPAVGERARGRRLAVGAGPGAGRALQPAAMRARTEPYRLERRVEVTWLTGACVAGPTDVLAALGPFDPALHMFGEDVDLGLRAAAAGDRARGSTRARAGSSTTARARRPSPTARARAGAPTGTLNWRAALRRAYGPRREWLGWLALRVNLRLRLLAKTLLGPRHRARPRGGRRRAVGPAGARAAAHDRRRRGRLDSRHVDLRVPALRPPAVRRRLGRHRHLPPGARRCASCAPAAERTVAFLADVEWLGTRLLLPVVAASCIVFGFLLANDVGYDFGADVARRSRFAPAVFSLIAGAGFLGPESGRIADLAAERGSGRTRGSAPASRRLLLVSRIELVDPDRADPRHGRQARPVRRVRELRERCRTAVRR